MKYVDDAPTTMEKYFRSPCYSCPNRKEEYTCIEDCNKPAHYTAQMGDMNKPLPVHMTHLGKDIHFRPTMLPQPTEIESAMAEKHSLGKKYKKANVCLWPGCREPVKKGYCHAHSIIANRRRRRWPLQFCYAPPMYPLELLEKREKAGELVNEGWYKLAIRQIEEGLLVSPFKIKKGYAL